MDMILERQGIKFRVTDDRGTTYRDLGGGGGGDSTNWDGSTRLTPPIPGEARRATIEVLDWNRWEMDLAAAQVLATVELDL
jgi:hypothetical protein